MPSYAQSTGFPSSLSLRATTAPQAMNASANASPKVLIEIPRMWISGFTAGAQGPGAPKPSRVDRLQLVLADAQLAQGVVPVKVARGRNLARREPAAGPVAFLAAGPSRREPQYVVSSATSTIVGPPLGGNRSRTPD